MSISSPQETSFLVRKCSNSHRVSSRVPGELGNLCHGFGFRRCETSVEFFGCSIMAMPVL